MIEKLGFFRKYLPLTATIGLFILMFALTSLAFPAFFSLQVFFNLLNDNMFILISAIGMTFVLISGGIDLSVASVIALTAMVSAWLVEWLNVNPFLTMGLVLLMGTVLGAGMGSLIQYLKIPPFVATLVGMFMARGLCFVISTEYIVIEHPIYRVIANYRIYLGDGFIKPDVVIAFVALLIAIFLLHYTRFGRTVYAIGGDEQSALLMGLPVGRTKVLIYTLNGFFSALAGVAYSFYKLSGHGLYAYGKELEVIASVVMGGTLLTGGVGYVLGTLFGVLIQGTIPVIIMFQGTLSSWWTKIVVGLITLFFIVMQRVLGATNSRR